MRFTLPILQMALNDTSNKQNVTVSCHLNLCSKHVFVRFSINFTEIFFHCMQYVAVNLWCKGATHWMRVHTLIDKPVLFPELVHHFITKINNVLNIWMSKLIMQKVLGKFLIGFKVSLAPWYGMIYYVCLTQSLYSTWGESLKSDTGVWALSV